MKNLKSTNLRLIGFFGTKKPINYKLIVNYDCKLYFGDGPLVCINKRRDNNHQGGGVFENIQVLYPDSDAQNPLSHRRFVLLFQTLIIHYNFRLSIRLSYILLQV